MTYFEKYVHLKSFVDILKGNITAFHHDIISYTLRRIICHLFMNLDDHTEVNAHSSVSRQAIRLLRLLESVPL